MRVFEEFRDDVEGAIKVIRERRDFRWGDAIASMALWVLAFWTLMVLLASL